LPGILGKLPGTTPVPSFTVIIWLTGTLVSFSTVPLSQVISRGVDHFALTQTEVDARVVRRHMAHPAFRLLVLREPFGDQLQSCFRTIAGGLGAHQLEH
jgi:hypothetical protein